MLNRTVVRMIELRMAGNGSNRPFMYHREGERFLEYFLIAIGCLAFLSLLWRKRFHPLLPILRPIKAEAIRHRIAEVVAERWVTMLDYLSLKGDLPEPGLKIDFISIRRPSHYKGKIELSSVLYTNEKRLRRTVDHELGHYLQYLKNPYVKQPPTYLETLGVFWMNPYWISTGRMNRLLVQKAFREGFAEYIEMMVNKHEGLHQGLLKDFEKIERSRRRLLFSKTLPCALGYLIFDAIARTMSAHNSMEIGLSQDPSTWIDEGRKAFRILGEMAPLR